eukprot:scaffold70166_cov59-Attheya_sp.AAC.5
MGYRKGHLKALNRCQLFLQVSSLSDITSGNGASILEGIWNGSRDTLNMTHRKWPGCSLPSPQDWTHWRNALRSLLYADAHSVAQRRLRQPLGDWTDCNEDWPWWYSPMKHRLYRKLGERWSVYLPPQATVRTRRLPRFRYHHSSASGPPDGMRTKVLQLWGDPAFRITGITPVRQPAPEVISPNLAERLQLRLPSRKWAMERFQAPDNGAALANAIQNGTTQGVNDGSFKLQHGTAAMVMVDPLLDDPLSPSRIVGCHVTPGNPADRSPYRSELSGIYGLLCITEEIYGLHNITTGGITIGCDNEKCLWMAIDKPGTISPKRSSFDFSAIRTKIRSLPISVTSHWVKAGPPGQLHPTSVASGPMGTT